MTGAAPAAGGALAEIGLDHLRARASPRAACRAAIARPWWNTTTRCASEMITSMMCSTITSVMPRRVDVRAPARSPARISVGVRPAIASSSSRTLGSVASARAISSRLRPGVPRLRAGRVDARAPRPTRSMHGAGLGRALRPRVGMAQEGADHDVVEHRHVLEGERHLEGAGDARAAARASGGSRVTSAPSKRTAPAVGGRSPVEAVEEGRLAGAVGADQAERSRPCSTATDGVVDRLEAAERLGDVAAPQAARRRLGSSAAAASCQQAEQAARQEAGEQHDDGAVDDEGEAGAPPPSRLLEISSSGTRITAPTSGPNSCPAPPSAAMISIFTEIRMPSPDSGSTKPNMRGVERAGDGGEARRSA